MQKYLWAKAQGRETFHPPLDDGERLCQRIAAVRHKCWNEPVWVEGQIIASMLLTAVQVAKNMLNLDLFEIEGVANTI